VDIEYDQFIDEEGSIKSAAAAQIQEIADYCAVDIFVLHPELDKGVAAVPNGSDISQDTRLKICIYGDVESVEFAKIRVLVMIDDMVC